MNSEYEEKVNELNKELCSPDVAYYAADRKFYAAEKDFKSCKEEREKLGAAWQQAYKSWLKLLSRDSK